MICEACHGWGYVKAHDQGVDACRACAARAEAEWRLRKPAAPRPPVLLIVPKENLA